MKRIGFIWLVFGICLGVVLGATGWITQVALSLDRQDAEAHRASELEENIRLALWRIDASLIPMIAQESSRPYIHFTTYYPIAGAASHSFVGLQDGQVLGPSPLLTFRSPYVKLHFQQSPEGTIESPQVPHSAALRALKRRFGEAVKSEQSSELLQQLNGEVGIERLADLAPDIPVETIDLASSSCFYNYPLPFLCCPSDVPPTTEVIKNAGNRWLAPNIAKEVGRARNEPSQQLIRSKTELDNRQQRLMKGCQLLSDANLIIPFQASDQGEEMAGTASEIIPKWSNVRSGPFALRWCGNELLLLRRVLSSNETYAQGCWLDWPALRTTFLDEIKDLLPGADLEPSPDWRSPELRSETRQLASAPIRLIPGMLPPSDARLGSVIVNSLIIAWTCVCVASLAFVLLIRSLTALNERRADFVSAVTHELRTPLTTFRMYTQMLRDGMVTDEEQRKTYLQTLAAESERLNHLVENVLSYARLDRGRSLVPDDTQSVGDLVDRVAPPLVSRTKQANVPFDISIEPEVTDCNIKTDLTAVGQILFNLVDNSVKYTGGSGSARIHLSAGIEPRGGSHGMAVFRVTDNGPGLSPSVERRLFKQFSRSAHEAAGSAPGVGLGLALCRRLARDLGGELRHKGAYTDGCCFELRIPLLNGQVDNQSREP